MNPCNARELSDEGVDICAREIEYRVQGPAGYWLVCAPHLGGTVAWILKRGGADSVQVEKLPEG